MLKPSIVPYLLPSANFSQALQTLPRWVEMGYTPIVFIDGDRARDYPEIPGVEVLVSVIGYRGYPDAIRSLLAHLEILSIGGPLHQVVVCGGDDMYPDPKVRAEEIRSQFLERFPDTYGVMQPTGDTQGTDGSGRPAAARICGSPWIGRAFWSKAYLGRGPFWPGYFHFYADEELHEVATREGILWQRPDLTQFHDHWSFAGRAQPGHIKPAQSRWEQDQATFFRRKAAGFPSDETLQGAN